MEPNIILKYNLEREKKLKELRENPKENASEISKLLTQLRNDYQSLIIEHTSYSCSGGKDIDGLLWKQCFYRQIEEYRRSIRKTVQLLEQTEPNPANAANMSTIEKAKAHLARLTAVFSKFLSDASTFYQELMLQLEARSKVAKMAAQQNSDKLYEDYLRCINRCLLYLGDLARYRELYAERREKDYSEAERYYERAAFVTPTVGNPQNQLAVLATYMESECVAVYHYCRSVMVKRPFAAGYENLTLLFDKNNRQYKQLKSGDGALQHQLHASLSHITDKSKKIIAYRVKVFLISYIRLHGMLYGWTRRALKYIAASRLAAEDASASTAESDHAARANNMNDANNTNAVDADADTDDRRRIRSNEKQIASATATTSALPQPVQAQLTAQDLMADFDATIFSELCHSVLEEFDQLVSISAFGEVLLVRLLIICIFSVHHGASVARAHLAGTTANASVTANATASVNANTNAPTTVGAANIPKNGSSTTAPISAGSSASTNEQDSRVTEDKLKNYPRILSESLALTLTFGFLNKTAKRIAAMWESADGKLRGAATVKGLLPVLSVFAEWSAAHGRYLVSMDPSSTATTATVAASSTSDGSSNELLGKPTAARGTGKADKDDEARDHEVNEGVGGASNGKRLVSKPPLDTLGEFPLRSALINREEGRSSPAPDDSEIGSSLAANKVLFADPDTLRAESRARSGFRSVLSSLKEFIETMIRSHAGSGGGGGAASSGGGGDRGGGGGGAGGTKGVDIKGKPLREHVELRGFLPLADQYEIYFTGIEPLARQLVVVPDETARDRRLRVLRALVKNWPTAASLHAASTAAAGASGAYATPAASAERSHKERRAAAEARRVGGGGLLAMSPELAGQLKSGRARDREREKSRLRDRDRDRDREKDGKMRDEGRLTRKEMRERKRDAMAAKRGEQSGNSQQQPQQKSMRMRGQGTDVDFERLQKRPNSTSERSHSNRLLAGASTAEGTTSSGAGLQTEDFPPLPGARDVSNSSASKAPLNYASSALFSSTAPTTMNPFDDDGEDDEDEEDEDDEEEEEESSDYDSDEEDDEEEGADGGEVEEERGDDRESMVSTTAAAAAALGQNLQGGFGSQFVSVSGALIDRGSVSNANNSLWGTSESSTSGAPVELGGGGSGRMMTMDESEGGGAFGRDSFQGLFGRGAYDASFEKNMTPSFQSGDAGGGGQFMRSTSLSTSSVNIGHDHTKPPPLVAVGLLGNEDEDDFADEVVVFKPAFSRVFNSSSPSLPPSSATTAAMYPRQASSGSGSGSGSGGGYSMKSNDSGGLQALGLRGVNSLGDFSAVDGGLGSMGSMGLTGTGSGTGASLGGMMHEDSTAWWGASSSLAELSATVGSGGRLSGQDWWASSSTLMPPPPVPASMTAATASTGVTAAATAPHMLAVDSDNDTDDDWESSARMLSRQPPPVPRGPPAVPYRPSSLSSTPASASALTSTSISVPVMSTSSNSMLPANTVISATARTAVPPPPGFSQATITITPLMPPGLRGSSSVGVPAHRPPGLTDSSGPTRPGNSAPANNASGLWTANPFYKPG